MVTLAVLACACGSSDDVGDAQAGGKASISGLDRVPDAGPCDSIVAGGGTVEWIVDPDCTGCEVADAANAADGNLDTFATLTYAAGSRSGGAAIRASAAPGREFVVGDQPYVLLGEPSVELAFHESWRTYRAGVPQDEEVNSGPAGTRASRNEWAIPLVTKPYDAYEYYHRLGNTNETAVLRVYELCNNLNGEGP